MVLTVVGVSSRAVRPGWSEDGITTAWLNVPTALPEETSAVLRPTSIKARQPTTLGNEHQSTTTSLHSQTSKPRFKAS